MANRDSFVRTAARLLPRETRSLGLWILACGMLIPAGCPSAGPPIGGSDGGQVGVTSGGQQDVALSRSQIERGWLPDPADITIEGFLSEHDIPLPVPPGAPEIYASVAYAWRLPYGDTVPVVDAFVSLGSTIDTSLYQRRPQNLVAVVDLSGSMEFATQGFENRTKLSATQQALHALVDQLGEFDRMAIVTFTADARVAIRGTPGYESDKLRPVIDSLKAEGSTNLFQGMQLGFETALNTGDADHDSRVIVFTDAVPTEGPASGPQFVEMQRGFADQGVGFTLMGIGEDYGQTLAQEISSVRGGNSFFLSSADRLTQLFSEEFDYFVSPAAFDLQMSVTVADGVGIREVYGVPDYVPGARSATIHIPTLFFSPRKGGGAIVVRFTLADDPSADIETVVAGLRMSYTLRDGTSRGMDGSVTLPAGLDPTGETAWLSDDTAARAVLLFDAGTVLMRAASAGFYGRRAEGAALIGEFLAEFDQRSRGMSDRTAPTSRGLSDERTLLQRLQTTLQPPR